MSKKHKQLTIPPCPPEGITVSVTATEVDDGDTITVELKRTLRVRLLNFSKPESNTLEGQQETNKLKDKISIGDSLYLFLPAFKPEQLLDNTSFNRVLGFVYNSKKESL